MAKPTQNPRAKRGPARQEPPVVRLLLPSEVKAVLGIKCRTNHALRLLEKRGDLRPIRIGARTLRYSPADVQKLIDDRRAA